VPTPQYLTPAQRVLASAPNLAAPLWGMTLTHPMFTPADHSFWLVNRPYAITATLEDDSEQDYEAAYFELKLPRLDNAGQQDAQISLQNVDRIIVDQLELANTQPEERIQVVLRLFVEDDLAAGPQNVPLQLSFSAVNATNAAVVGVAGRPDTLNRAFPAFVYRVTEWPGLDR
jgi:hypothetical protein